MKPSRPLFFLMLVLVIMISLALPMPAKADDGENGLTLSQILNGYTVTIVFDKPVIVGENPIHIQLVDAAGMPMNGADVEISLVEAGDITAVAESSIPNDMIASPTLVAPTQSSMTGMSDMSASNPAQPTNTPSAMTSINSMSPVGQSMSHDEMGMVALDAGSESGMYEGALMMESDGAMIVRAHITINGKLSEVDFPVQVAKSKSGAIILLSFFVFNGALILAALVMKSRSASLISSSKA